MLALAACDTTTREARRMVRRAEQLADTLPDSTLRLIDSVLHMAANFNERERMDMSLLQAEVLFGDHGQELSPVMDDDFFDDHGNVNTSPELERASAYYAKKEDYAKAAHAALYSGFVQQHYDEKKAAMHSFKEAVQYGMMAGDSLTMAQAEYRMGKMLIDDGVEQEALPLLMAALTGFGNGVIDKALTNNMISVCYMLHGDFDNAEKCLRQSLLDAATSQSDKVLLKTKNNFAVLQRLQGKYDAAIACLREMADISNFDETEMFVYCLNMGKTFASANEMDSASLYFQKVEAMLPNTRIKLTSRISAYGALSQYTERQGYLQKALLYKAQREEAMSNLLVQIQKQNTYRIQRQYDYESLQNEMNRKIIKKHVTNLIVSILLLISTVIVLILQHRQKQLLKEEEETKRQMDAMKQDLRQMVKASDLGNGITSQLRTIILAKRTEQRAKDPQNEWRPLVLQIINNELDSFKAACRVLETAYPNLYSTILEKHPDLTETEARICLLSYSDLSNAEIAELLGLRTNTVNQNRSNLRKKMNLKSERMKEQLREALSN